MNRNLLQTAPPAEIIAAKRAERLKTTSDMFKPLMKRIYAKTASPRECIKAFCLECVGFDRNAIAECSSYACPHWNLRPFKKSGSLESRVLAPANPLPGYRGDRPPLPTQRRNVATGKQDGS